MFQKVPKNAVFRLFSKICLQRRKCGKIRIFTMVWESSENQFGRPKNKIIILYSFNMSFN